MQPFLTKIIDKILEDKAVPLHDVAVILPNRRARRQLLKGLSERNGGKPMFAPQIFPMEEFVSWLSPLKVIDSVTQLMRLHTLTRDYPGTRFEMHNLLSWGNAFLKDISDMDMQLQDVPAILKEFSSAAHFEVPFGKDNVSQEEQEKLQFYDLLADIYVQYKVLLAESGEAFEGMIYRDCAENVADYAQKLPFKRLIFAGFYALSPSELTIISYLKEHLSEKLRTEIYFDIDPFYCHLEGGDINNQGLWASGQRETSFFIQRNCEKLRLDIHHLDFFEKDYENRPKKVMIVSTSKNMRQIYAAIREVERIEMLKKSEKGNGQASKERMVDMSDTAVVLADENLLLPFLLSYHSDNVTINATMGFPFEATPVYALLQQLLAVYESVFALTADEATELVFSGELMEQLWNQELLRSQNVCDSCFPTVIKYSQIPHNELFVNCPKTMISRQLPSILLQFCAFAESVTTEELYLQLWQEVRRKLTDAQAKFDYFLTEKEVMDFAFAKFALTRWLGEVSISMQGDPDTGLQVMGLLETRMMDYRNVIMLSVNEGILPKGISYDSLLPFDFKYKFDGQEALPNYLYQDQVYAYHFFRLLQRADNVMLIYNSASDVSLAEKSRLITQLEYEVKTQHLEDVIHIEHQLLDFNLSLPVRKSLSIPKTPEVMERLSQFTFSASSLQNYIACPLKFYFQHLMKIREERVLSDRLEAYELGTVIHALFKSALDEIKQEADPQCFESILQKHINSLDSDICKEISKLKGRESLKQSDLEQGYWLINRRIIEETVLHYLEKAKEELPSALPWRIFANEMKVDIRDYLVRSADGQKEWQVKLTGSLDRVQKNGREVMILDYKTGKVEAGHLRVSVKKADENDQKVISATLDKIFTDSKYDKLFQLVMYMLMYDHYSKEKPTAVQAGIVSTREVNMNHAEYIFRSSLFGDFNLLNFKELLSERLNMLLCEIYDETLPFSQTEDEDKCKMCDFLHLCGRQTATESRM
jgi:hypothetical protein